MYDPTDEEFDTAYDECDIFNPSLSIDRAKELIDHVMSFGERPAFINMSITRNGDVGISFSYDEES